MILGLAAGVIVAYCAFWFIALRKAPVCRCGKQECGGGCTE